MIMVAYDNCPNMHVRVVREEGGNAKTSCVVLMVQVENNKLKEGGVEFGINRQEGRVAFHCLQDLNAVYELR